MLTYTNFPRYLSSKKSVDDRALNQKVWDALASTLDTQDDLEILEIGGGIGTMVERLLENDLLEHVHYTLLDEQAENIAKARQRLSKWADEEGFTVSWEDEVLHLWKMGKVTKITFLAEDLFDFLARQNFDQKYDLLIAHAFLDLVDIPATLPKLFKILRPKGHFYFTINFDGETIFEPEIPHDKEIITRYQQTMDERIIDGKLSGDSHAGRHLFEHLRAAGGEILSAGSSDWVVFSQNGNYPADEAYFLHFIVTTVHDALLRGGEIAPRRIDAWASARHAQITSGALVYIAHQLDFFGKIQ
ncbi:MAG: class I SAM-dependent methyltransferase [Anaerolineae bacterium]|jgi:SAM-dependent methyltransferase|nr:class I SAM-dependent methyltransferase [Anaerolineae bacterium]MBT4311899.1 class I SAM-dependent methyltransferase [Anaerolineae bacterium]MBT4459182.1 class I SAM-dependent methyltransferase [Anaerolineae bacterium]MBT4841415.1 class I SAM-dependent methyltransferase [Anaerolineae bacterium]MBT6059658.1 class I SAM-dependent methyltransferase [Anaerolineae bacterium]